MIKTRWCVFTGAPCSGKTTAAKHLEGRGYKWIPDAEKLHEGSDQLKHKQPGLFEGDNCAFLRHLTMLRCNIESILNPEELIFFDGGLPDNITHFRVAQLDQTGVIESCKRFLYHRVFIFEPIKFEWNGTPINGDEYSLFLNLHLEIAYRELGYSVIRVPAVSLEKRIELILKAL